MSLRVTVQNDVSVYTVSGSNTTRTLPDWLARKRKRSLKNDLQYQNRIELIQDFEFEEASQCIRVSPDGEFAMATGTYKPQHRVYHLPSSALKYEHHMDSLNVTFLLLSTDYRKALFLQEDRSLKFYTPQGCHYATRIPRYGRALAYLKPLAQAVVPAEGNEVFRLDLEGGRFLKPFALGGYSGEEYDVKSVECVAVADGSHGLLAFGTSAGTTEFWDPRSRNRVGILSPVSASSQIPDKLGDLRTPAVTSTAFHDNGLTLATGNEAGMVALYDLRSPNPVLTKDQGYGFAIKSLHFVSPTNSHGESWKVMSSDKRIIKLWDMQDGKPWTSIEPTVDINHVEPIKDTGMILTANEGREMHSFLIPALGPSPWWCQHLDTQIEQLADARVSNDPDAYANGSTEASTYDNYKFLTKPELRELNLDHLLSSGRGAGLIRPYMHGYFIAQNLYDEARLISDPNSWERERKKIIDAKLEKERESRIRTSKKDQNATKVRQNERLAEKLRVMERKADRAAAKKAHPDDEERSEDEEEEIVEEAPKTSVFADPRFGGLFDNPDFAVDETSTEFKMLNPSTRPVETGNQGQEYKRRKTAVEEEDEDDNIAGSSDEESSEDEAERPSKSQKPKPRAEPQMRISSSTYRKAGHDNRGFDNSKPKKKREKTFGEQAASFRGRGGRGEAGGRGGRALGGDREVTFYPGAGKEKPESRGDRDAGGGRGGRGRGRGRGDRGRGRGGRGRGRGRGDGGGGGDREWKDRRSASGNTLRRQGVR